MNKTNACTRKFEDLTVEGSDEGGPGSLSGSCFCLNISANCSIRCDDSSMASADKSSKVTRSTKKKSKNRPIDRIFSNAKIITYDSNPKGF